MIDKLPQSRVNGILRSFKSVFKHKDISYLTKNAYDYIYLASGFIAHYNVHGFRAEYENVYMFAQRILNNRSNNQWSNFRPNEENYEYYMQKRDIYNAIVELIKENFEIRA